MVLHCKISWYSLSVLKRKRRKTKNRMTCNEIDSMSWCNCFLIFCSSCLLSLSHKIKRHTLTHTNSHTQREKYHKKKKNWKQQLFLWQWQYLTHEPCCFMIMFEYVRNHRFVNKKYKHDHDLLSDCWLTDGLFRRLPYFFGVLVYFCWFVNLFLYIILYILFVGWLVVQ